MSADYTKGGLLFYTTVASGAHSSDGAVLGYIYTKNQPIVLHTFDAYISKPGVQASSQISLQSLNGSTTYASILVGTDGGVTASGTAAQLEARVNTSWNRVAAGSVLKIVANTTDASVGYACRVFGSPPCF